MQLPLNTPLHLLITTDAVGGVWTYTLDLARSLRQHGLTITIAALGPAPSRTQIAQADATGAALRIVDAPLDWLADDEAGVARASHAIAALARQVRADLIQTHSPAFLAHAPMPAPTVSVVHSCVATWWYAVRGGDMPADLHWRARLVDDGLARATFNIAPTRSFAFAVARAYGREPPLVVHNARETKSASDRACADFILSAGRFWDESKDVVTLDRAASLCALPVIAAGPLASPYGSHVEPAHVVARGSLEATELQALLEQRPIFCSTAVYEPFGLAVLEAAQAGCALVLSAIPTFQELWGDAALFAPARDHKAFAAAMDALARDPEWRAALGEKARARAATFSPEQQASGMLQVYARALDPARAEAAA
jgi:glycosyltransferase involved in cell wall biosynthesis